jgi:hypothetical protein
MTAEACATAPASRITAIAYGLAFILNNSERRFHWSLELGISLGYYSSKSWNWSEKSRCQRNPRHSSRSPTIRPNPPARRKRVRGGPKRRAGTTRRSSPTPSVEGPLIPTTPRGRALPGGWGCRGRNNGAARAREVPSPTTTSPPAYPPSESSWQGAGLQALRLCLLFPKLSRRHEKPKHIDPAESNAINSLWLRPTAALGVGIWSLGFRHGARDFVPAALAANSRRIDWIHPSDVCGRSSHTPKPQSH